MSSQRIVLAGLLFSAAPFLGACKTSSPTPAQPPEHALSGLAAQHVVLLPTYVVRVAPGLGWTVPRLTEVARTLRMPTSRGVPGSRDQRRGSCPVALDSAFRRNPTYATDPHTLAEEPLRSPSLSGDQRLPRADRVAAAHDRRAARRHAARARAGRASDRGGDRGGGGRDGVCCDSCSWTRGTSTVRWIGDVTSDPRRRSGRRSPRASPPSSAPVSSSRDRSTSRSSRATGSGRRSARATVRSSRRPAPTSSGIRRSLEWPASRVTAIRFPTRRSNRSSERSSRSKARSRRRSARAFARSTSRCGRHSISTRTCVPRIASCLVVGTGTWTSC